MKKSKSLILIALSVLVVVLVFVVAQTLSSPSDSPSGGVTGFQPSNVTYAANDNGDGSSEISVSGSGDASGELRVSGSGDRSGEMGVSSAGVGSGEISVSGTGAINVNPDVAYISLGVSTKGIDPKATLEENNRSIAAVISAVREKGVAEKDIRTTDFNMYPDYNYGLSEFKDQILGYTVSNNVSIVVRDITVVGDVLGAAADAGANVSGGVQFGMLDNSEAYNEALGLAIKNAVGKAEAIAGALGKSIGSPSSVSEAVNYYSPYYAAAENLSMNAAVGSVPVQTGKLTVSANVQMVYEFTK